ncbi:MAG: Tetratricopeptide 2 repeat protein [Spartobacteria bacterium]|nr:Tetratricopeptide 2 repeat protein [Spartobacteria bacterium]
MAIDPESNLRLQIGHVLFIDLVGYSKLLIEEQKQWLRQLTDIVLATTQVREATDEQLVRLPTGDGMALVFRNSAEEPAQCALEITEALPKESGSKEKPQLRLRMGIHSGPVSEVTDVSGRTNITGGGINMAQRVMDCGDAGHILLSKHVANDLQEHRQWSTWLHDLGECEVKHGVRLSVVNLYRDGVGNAQLPKKFRLLRKRRVRMRWAMAAAALLLVAATVAAFVLVSRRTMQSILTEKSIAVLPLVNMSGDPNNEYFSDGLSEELIAVLTKIPALKIIGRSSSFLFKGTSDDSRTIGKKLGVANLLEGTVRKEGDHIRIMAELIKVADGQTVWTQTYNRELKDVFAVQSEIATAVTDQLEIKLLGVPPRSDAAPSNQNLAAYNAFQQGNFYMRGNIDDTRKAIAFYDEAIRLDPKYALAYAVLGNSWRVMCILGGDSRNSPYAIECGPQCSVAYAKARSAVQTALSLAPNLADAYLVKGSILLNQDRDFDAATIQFRKAEELEPGSAEAKTGLAFLLMINGRLEEAEDLTRKTLRLDPLNGGGYEYLGKILIARERYDEAETVLRKGIDLYPKKVRWRVHITAIDLLRGQTKAALEEARLEPAGYWQDYALALAQQGQGDRAAADAALQKFIQKYGDEAAFQIASMYALRKEPNEMFAWLERAYAANDLGLPQLLIAPFLNKYRDDPRFTALWQKIKLPARQPAEVKQ